MSDAAWRHAVQAARAGSPRMLLQLLLAPRHTDGPGSPIPGPGGQRPFCELPDDLELRQQIVSVLLFGPWPRDGTIEQLCTRDGWGQGKPTLSELEVAFADVQQQLLRQATLGGLQSDPAEALESLAESLGVKAETLRKRIDRMKRRPRR